MLLLLTGTHLQLGAQAVQVGLEEVLGAGVHHLGLDGGGVGGPAAQDTRCMGGAYNQTFVTFMCVWYCCVRPAQAPPGLGSFPAD